MAIPQIPHKPCAVGAEAAVSDVCIERLFDELFTGVLIERTRKAVMAVFAH